MNDYKFQQANPPYRPEPNEKIIDNWANVNTPYDEPSEQAVCGAVLIGGIETYRQVSAVVEQQDFFLLRLRYIWEAFERVAGQGLDVDNLTVETALKESGQLKDIGGPAYLTQLCNATGTHLNAVSYAYTVRLHGIRRRGMALADTIKSACYNTQTGIHISLADLSIGFNKLLSELPNMTTKSTGELTEQIEFDINNPLKVKPAIPSGLQNFDDLIGGFTAGNVYLFGADTGMGKSSLLQNFVINNPDKRIAYFSTEMTSKAVMGRLLKIQTGITQRMIREQVLSESQKHFALETLQELGQRPLYIDYDPNNPLTPERLKARALQLKGAHGMDMLIVDHVTDMQPAKGLEMANEVQVQGNIAYELTLLAKALNVPVLAAVQLNRQVRNLKDARPNRSHIRGSGRWEQLAAVITLLYREDVYNPASEYPNTAELIVDKVRDDGETGTVRVYCDKARTRFTNALTRTVNFNNYEPPAPDGNIEF